MFEIVSGRTPPTICPGCSKTLDAATGVNGVSPTPGDFSVCVYCKAWLVFNDDLTMRLADDADLAQLDPDQLAILKHITKSLQAAFP